MVGYDFTTVLIENVFLIDIRIDYKADFMIIYRLNGYFFRGA